MKPRVRIKFCGGCNPDYDRGGLVEQIKEALKGKVTWISSKSEPADLVCVIQGCETACADLSECEGCELHSITRPSDAGTFIRYINKKAAGNINRRNDEIY